VIKNDHKLPDMIFFSISYLIDKKYQSLFNKNLVFLIFKNCILKSGGTTMGLSIHYSGSIAKPELLADLIEDLEDIAKLYEWEYKVYERQFPVNSFGKRGYNQEIHGISFTPPGCETIFVTFLSNGRLCSVPGFLFWAKTKDRQESKYLYMLSVKTQYAGIEAHMLIIQLFRFLNKKYFVDFKMTDEGEFWETNDENILQSNFQEYEHLINSFATALQTCPIKTGEDIESYLERLMKLIRDKKMREE